MRAYLIRYVIGGLFVFVISMGILYLFVDILGMWYLWGTTLAYVLSIAVSFTVQKYWTFRSYSTEGIVLQASTYVMFVLFNLVVNDGLMYLFVDIARVSHLVAQFVVTGCIAAWSFFAYKYLFHGREKRQI